MSINKFIENFSAIKGFFSSNRIERQGFLVFELMVAIFIITLSASVLFKFNSNIISVQGDSCKGLDAIELLSASFDGVGDKSGFQSEKKDGFELNFSEEPIKIVKNTVYGLKNRGFEQDSFKLVTAVVKIELSSGFKSTIKVIGSKHDNSFGFNDFK